MAPQPRRPLRRFPPGKNLFRPAAMRRLQRLSGLCQREGGFKTLWLLGSCPARIFRGQGTSTQSGRLVLKPDRPALWLGKRLAAKPGRTGGSSSPSKLAQPDGGGAAPSRPEAVAAPLPAAKSDG